MKRKRIVTYVPEKVQISLSGEKDDRSLSAHVAKVLTEHVGKREVSQNISKQEYGKDN